MSWIFILLFSVPSTAQILKDKNRVSPSYQSATQCFPTLQSKELQNDFSLRRLKEKIDQAYPNVESFESSKMWIVKNPKNERIRITLKTKEGSPVTKTLSVEKLKDNDVGEELSIPSAHRLQPTQKIINSYIFGNDIQEEITEKIDTKLNGLKNVTKQARSGLIWLELRDSRAGAVLLCEPKEKLGIICLCRKK